MKPLEPKDVRLQLTCCVCGNAFLVRKGKEAIAKLRCVNNQPIWCSKRCKVSYQAKQRELDIMDAHGEKASGTHPLLDAYNPLEDTDWSY